MLPEIMLYATASTSPDIRKLGLVGDAIALWSRAGRCRTAWRPHETRCTAAVERAIDGLPSRRTALVLGSGLLRDVAFEALGAAFARVVLVDAVHLWPARRRGRRAHVSHVVADLTGGAARREPPTTPGLLDPLAPFRADETVDFVLSANVLSQLPMAVVRWRERHRAVEPAGGSDPAAAIVRAHLAGLLRFGAPVCLLTDIRHQELARDGAILGETDLLHGTRLPPPDESWDWEVAPFGEVSRNARHVHRVHAYRDLARVCAHDGRAEAS